METAAHQLSRHCDGVHIDPITIAADNQLPQQISQMPVHNLSQLTKATNTWHCTARSNCLRCTGTLHAVGQTEEMQMLMAGNLKVRN